MAYICTIKIKQTITVMKTKSQIMKEAHLIAKTFVGDYKACFSEALRISWKNAKENFTPDFIKVQKVDLANASVKDVFNAIMNGKTFGGKFDYSVSYSIFAESILNTVMKNSNGFQADIAEKAYLEGLNLSEKQAWCVAYEYKKVA